MAGCPPVTFVLNRKVFDYISEPGCHPLNAKSHSNAFPPMASYPLFVIEGFFFAMDTYREFKHLNDLWAAGVPPPGRSGNGVEVGDRPVLEGPPCVCYRWYRSRYRQLVSQAIGRSGCWKSSVLVRDWVPTIRTCAHVARLIESACRPRRCFVRSGTSRAQPQRIRNRYRFPSRRPDHRRHCQSQQPDLQLLETNIHGTWRVTRSSAPEPRRQTDHRRVFR